MLRTCFNFTKRKIYNLNNFGFLSCKSKIIKKSNQLFKIRRNYNTNNKLICHRGLKDGIFDRTNNITTSRINFGITENTLSSVLNSYEKKFNSVEIDVRKTKDDKILLMHDDSLRRLAIDQTENILDEKITDLYWNDIKRIAIGYKKNGNFDYPCLLEDLLSLLNKYHTLFVEIKGCGKIFDLVADIIKDYNGPGNIVIISFNYSGIITIKKKLPKHECYYLIEKDPTNKNSKKELLSDIYLAYKNNLDGVNVNADYNLINQQIVEYTKNLNLKFFVWGSSDCKENNIVWNKLFSCGIDGFTTDYPKDLKSFLKKDLKIDLLH